MPHSFSESLLSARKKAKLTQDAAVSLLNAHGLSVQKRALGGYERGENEPDRIKQEAILRVLSGIPGSTRVGQVEKTADTVESYGVGDRALPDPYRATFVLTVYTHLRASAGPGLFGWEPADESDALRVERSKQLFAELIGFWPPDTMEGIRVEGSSMRRPDGGIADGQIVLYVPVSTIESGDRYVLAVQDEAGDLDTRILVKRLQAYLGGGIKIISDNPHSGVDDEVLIPDADLGLINERTGRAVTVRVLGRVVWPTNYLSETVALAVSQAIERLVGTHAIPRAAVQP